MAPSTLTARRQSRHRQSVKHYFEGARRISGAQSAGGVEPSIGSPSTSTAAAQGLRARRQRREPPSRH